MMGYGTLGGDGAATMSFMAGGGNNLAQGGFDPKSAGHFMNVTIASKIDQRHKAPADDGDISVEDQSLADQILKL